MNRNSFHLAFTKWGEGRGTKWRLRFIQHNRKKGQNSGFINLGCTDILSQVLLALGELSCIMQDVWPRLGLCPLDARSSPLALTTKNVSGYCQQPREAKLPPVENQRLYDQTWGRQRCCWALGTTESRYLKRTPLSSHPFLLCILALILLLQLSTGDMATNSSSDMFKIQASEQRLTLFPNSNF